MVMTTTSLSLVEKLVWAKKKKQKRSREQVIKVKFEWKSGKLKIVKEWMDIDVMPAHKKK